MGGGGGGGCTVLLILVRQAARIGGNWELVRQWLLPGRRRVEIVFVRNLKK